jgi:hypothetical protein
VQPPEVTRFFIDTGEKVGTSIAAIYKEANVKRNSIYIDTEGRDMALLNIYCPSTKTVHLFDMHTLGKQALDICPTGQNINLRRILTSSRIKKVIWDLRLTNILLRKKFDVKMRYVEDLQLTELAARSNPDGFLRDLTRALSETLPLARVEPDVVDAAVQTRRAGRDATLRGSGGSQDELRRRPLNKVVEDYCVNDVRWLHVLWVQYRRFMPHADTLRVMAMSKKRLAELTLPQWRQDRKMAHKPRRTERLVSAETAVESMSVKGEKSAKSQALTDTSPEGRAGAAMESSATNSEVHEHKDVERAETEAVAHPEKGNDGSMDATSDVANSGTAEVQNPSVVNSEQQPEAASNGDPNLTRTEKTAQST